MKRRDFLSGIGAAGLLAGVAPVLGAASRLGPFEPSLADPDEKLFAEARKHFLIPAGVVYCNTGTLGASPVEVVTALAEGNRKLERELADWPYEKADGEPLTGYQELKDVRTLAGSLINATVDEVAITQNATVGMSMLANGLDLAAGDEVVSTDHEHAGGISGWRVRAKRHGVVVKEVPLDPLVAGGPDAIVKAFAEAMTPKTKVLMFSHITSGLGVLMPATELCALARQRGVLAIVDGAQALGQIPVDVKALGADAYVASPHKWLMAPKGTGILYIRRELQDRFWTTLASTRWDAHDMGAFRFMQYGTGSVPVAEGLVAALTFVNKIGLDRIARWDRMLTTRLRDGLEKIPAARLSSPSDRRLASAITTFRVEGMKAKALQDALWAKKIRVRAQGDPRGVRLSAHMYVMPADIDAVLAVVRGAA
jgi:isopenicillin-N epimerase